MRADAAQHAPADLGPATSASTPDRGAAAPRAMDIGKKTSPHSLKNKLARALWGVVQPTLFRCSPRPLHAWRRLLLSLFGADMAPGSKVLPRARVWGPWNLTMGRNATIGDDVDVYCVDRITIGDNTTVSQYSYLCGATHDHEHPRFPLVPMPITIGASVWVAADCFVGPGVIIGEGTVVGARSTVVKDLPEWMVCAGSPARPVKQRVIGDATPHENLPKGERPGDQSAQPHPGGSP